MHQSVYIPVSDILDSILLDNMADELGLAVEVWWEVRQQAADKIHAAVSTFCLRHSDSIKQPEYGIFQRGMCPASVLLEENPQ